MANKLIRVKTAFADAIGRSYKEGKVYTVDEQLAGEMVEADYAEEVQADCNNTVNLLKAQGAGLYILAGTDAALIEAAKRNKLKVYQAKSSKKDDGGTDSA